MTPEIEAYRDDARAWLEAHVTDFGRVARRGLTEEEDLTLGRRWQAAKFDAGYAGINWPKEHGGQGLTLLHRLAFESEEIKHGFPNDYFAVSLGMPVPIILKHLPDGWKQERSIAHCAATRSGASSSPNRPPAPTWRGCVPALSRIPQLATGESMARSCGRPGRNIPTMALSSPAPTRTSPSIVA